MRWSKRTPDRVLGITQIKSDPFERAFSAVCERYSLDADPETLARSSSIEKSERPVSTRGATARGIASEAASVRRSHER